MNFKLTSRARGALRSVLVMTVAACALAPAARGQGASIVVPGDLAYRDVDRLVELGVLDSVIVGQRPYTRREFGRILRIARERLDRGGSNVLVSDREALVARAGSLVLARLNERFSDEADQRMERYPLLAVLDGAALIFTSTNAERRGFPAPHTAPIEALVDPLAEPRLAQPAVRGGTAALELSQRLAPTDWLSFHARERIEGRAPLDTSIGRLRGELLLGGVRLRLGNLLVGVGREPLAWAQSENDGLFFASDAPAIDQISLQSDAPFGLPGPLSRIGPTKATLVISDLGPSATRTNSKLLAYKVSTMPANWLELGGTFFNHFGGAGGAKSSFGNRLIDFLPFIDVFRRHNYTDTTQTFDVDSDKLLGVDGRVRIDGLAGMTVAGEILIDDFDVHSLQRMLTGYGSSNIRLIFPVVGSPRLAARIAAKHMGTITYSHFALTSGITSRGRLLGEELGPDAKEFSGDLRWTPGSSATFILDGREQIYSNATYGGGYTDASMVQTYYSKLSSFPDERRHILVGSLVLRPAADLSLTLRVGGQVVENYAFKGYQRTDYVAGLALRLRQ